MQTDPSPNHWNVAKRQAAAIGLFMVMLGLIVGLLYWTDRQREWRLRKEQAAHRLELAYELMTRDLERVQSDILYVANQRVARRFDSSDDRSRAAVENEFSNFLRLKRSCQQIRLIETSGQESVRVDLRGTEVVILPETERQDKSARYYVRNSLQLKPGKVFISEFDLNQEHGVIEQPLNPVIRFVTKVSNERGGSEYLLVANYRGATLLNDLTAISLPGKTFLIREDGHYLLGPNPDDAWGWLLNHPRRFDRQYTSAWNNRTLAADDCIRTDHGAFAFRQIQMQKRGRVRSETELSQSKRLFLVSYLSADKVFETSNQLLSRLLTLAFLTLLPLSLLARFWAVASVRRQHQNLLILESEKRLRELSSSLVRIQEEERRAISREIHDQLGQQATAINLDLKLAQRDAKSKNISNQLQQAINASEHLLETLHDFAARVRPVELDDLGLHDAVESHLWDFKNRTRIDFEFDSNLDQLCLPAVISENVYRLIQESLNNVVKHANATRVAVSIMLEISDTGRVLNICVQDDGVGALEAVEQLRTDGKDLSGRLHLGILGMRERVDLLGGSLNLISEEGIGTKVLASVPIDQAVNATSREGSVEHR